MGDCADQPFASVILNQKDDDGFPACRNGADARGDFIAKAARVGRGFQRVDGRFDLGGEGVVLVDEG
ncbi:MAG: hypothetical protein WCO04_09165 [Pseudomonadota bacterium]